MFKRIAAIGFILVCTAIAWAILGTTIFARTEDRLRQNRGPDRRPREQSGDYLGRAAAAVAPNGLLRGARGGQDFEAVLAGSPARP